MAVDSDSTGDGPEVLVQPGEHFLHDLCPVDHHVVGRIANDVPLVLLRRQARKENLGDARFEAIVVELK